MQSSMGIGPAYWRKSSLIPAANRYAGLALLEEGRQPQIYLIPSLDWRTPDGVLVDRTYEGSASAPEWGDQSAGRARRTRALRAGADARSASLTTATGSPRTFGQTPDRDAGRPAASPIAARLERFAPDRPSGFDPTGVRAASATTTRGGRASAAAGTVTLVVALRVRDG